MIANGQIVYYHYSSHPTSSFGRHLVYKIDGAWGTRWVHCAHLTDQDFKTGGTFTEGYVIGHLGKSGTQSAHLHFSIFKVDPVTFPQGIDNVANNQAELLQYWEDPLVFLNTWMAPITTPVPVITPQTKIPQILDDNGNPMEVQAILSTLNDLKNNLSITKQKLNAVRAIVV